MTIKEILTDASQFIYGAESNKINAESYTVAHEHNQDGKTNKQCKNATGQRLQVNRAPDSAKCSGRSLPDRSLWWGSFHCLSKLSILHCFTKKIIPLITTADNLLQKGVDEFPQILGVDSCTKRLLEAFGDWLQFLFIVLLWKLLTLHNWQSVPLYNKFSTEYCTSSDIHIVLDKQTASRKHWCMEVVQNH